MSEPYASLADLKSYMSIEQDMYDDVLIQALDSASREIELHCNRQFNKDVTASSREFDADNRRWVHVDDFWTPTGLVVETGPGFSVTWATTDYRLRPLNGVVDGQPGWPFSKLVPSGMGRYRFDRYGVRVTAKWGWVAVPAPVKQACLIMAAETFQIKDAPFGVAGMDQYGAIRVRDNRMAQTKLRRYCRDPIPVG
ncbi:head-tail connector protein [Streptomyces sp. NPDC018019]|uniref:head-tail connector protein n=1 Tax=Streptomyces sp. NPDC018019 TaxID=3365030 RepID=UPI0037A4DD77